MARLSARVAYFLLIIAIAGCGSSKVKVQGRVTMDGKPVEVGRREALEIAFVPVPEPGKSPSDSFMGDVNPDGTYVVEGPGRKGIPRGKYQVGIKLVNDATGSDKWKGKYSADSSTRIVDVTGDDIDIDFPSNQAARK